MWAFYRFLEIINYIVIAIASFGFLGQVFFLILCWLPKKSYPKAPTKARFAIIIPAHNESSVIGTTVEYMLKRIAYPKELYDVFVCADNCTDDTAAVAKKAGAIVIERSDSNPNKRRASFPVRALTKLIITEYKGKYDAVVRFDADNLCNPEFLSKVNDALAAGVEIAKAYECSKNLKENVWSQVSGTYYIRDSRLPGRVRSALGLDQIIQGAGMIIATKVLEETNGYDAMSTSIEDTEFCVKRLLEGRKLKFVEDAIVYEDQPASLKDTFGRLTRMGHGLHSLFWRNAHKLIGKFFMTGRFSYIDFLQTMLFIPIAVLASLWFPLYYIFFFIINSVQGFFAINVGLFPNALPNAMFPDWPGWRGEAAASVISLVIPIVMFLVSYLVIFAGQTFLAVSLDHKKNNLNWWCQGVLKGILLSPVFMMLYAVAITVGVMSKPQWQTQIRSKTFDDISIRKK